MSVGTSIATYRDAAAAAVAAGDYATAIQQSLAAKALISCLPSTSALSQSTQWNSTAIDSFIAMCLRESSAALGTDGGSIQRSKIHRHRVTW